jgi:hypothetical protein
MRVMSSIAPTESGWRRVELKGTTSNQIWAKKVYRWSIQGREAGREIAGGAR